MTTVGLLGDGPAIEAVRATLDDTAATTVDVGIADADRPDVTVAVGPTGGRFEAVEIARDSQTPLLIVELGGVGGTPVEGVAAAISGYSPGSACYDCLCGRVTAADQDTDDGEYDAATARLAGSIAGYELVKLVTGGQPTVIGGVIEVPYSERRVLPLPYCACSSGDERFTLRYHHEDRSLEQSISMAEVAFDARVGPISDVGEIESFPAPYYLATLAETPFSDADVPEHAAGVAIDWNPAFMKAIGEALERYSAAVYRRSEFVTDPDDPIDPRRFAQPGDAPETVKLWYEAEALATGQTVQLPAEAVVFPPPERRIRPAITTGLGFGNGGVDALLSGLYEVVERDAAMLSWYSTFEPLGLAVDDDSFQALAARLRSEGLETAALLLTQDVDVPVVAACVYRDGEWPHFAAGMAANLDPGAAAHAALEEAVQNWLELRRMGPQRTDEASGAIGQYADFPESVREFVTPETTVPASAVGTDEPPEGRRELDTVVDRIHETSLEVYAARLTPRDVEAMGFEATRVVVPGAQPLFTDDSFFGERAHSVPEQMGFEPRLDREHHPFP